jgi:hypothetical protein
VLSLLGDLFPYYIPDLTALAVPFPTHSSPFPPHLECRIVVHPRIVRPRKRFASCLDLAFLKEHRGRHTPSPSIWKLVPDWVWSQSGVADTAEVLQLDVPVPVEVLRPRDKYVQTTLDAVEDIRFCEKLFDDWMIELDKCVANRFSQPRVPSNHNNGFTVTES